MPPKSSTNSKSLPQSAASAKLASIPNRPKDISKLNPPTNGLTSNSSSSGSGGRPNKVAYNSEQDQFKREIDSIQAKIADIRLQIGDPKIGGGNGPLLERRKALREELDALRAEQSKGKSSRSKILDQIRIGNENVQRKIKELNASRGKLPYKSGVEVDAKIRQLEAQIESGTMRIVEEKKAIAEIQTLRKARKLADGFEPQQEAIEAEKEKIESLRKQLDDPDNKNLNDRWAEIKVELDQLNDKLSESCKSRDKLFDERNRLQDSLTRLYEKKRESALNYKEANDKYYAKMQEDQQRRIERQKAERDALEASKLHEIHAEMREEASAPAYEREIEDCRTLILYFDKLLGNAPVAEDDNSLNKNTTNGVLPQLKDLRKVDADEAFQGMVPVKKKGAEQEEFFMGGGGKKGKKNKKLTNNEATTANNPNQPLHLPLSTLNALHALAVTVPMTREDVVGTIAALSEKKKWFSENQERVTTERIKETEAKILAVEAKLKPVKAEDDTENVEPKAEAELSSVQS